MVPEEEKRGTLKRKEIITLEDDQIIDEGHINH